MAVERSQGHLVREHFQKVAADYASFYQGESSETHSFNIRLRRVSEMLSPKVGTMVDVGCGPGILLRRVLEERHRSPDPSARLVGLDFAAEMVREADRFVNAEGNARRSYFLCGEAGRLPFGEGTVDTVTCMGLMEYLDDEESVLAEVSRAMRPEGIVIITLPNLWSPYRLWHRLLNRVFRALRAMFPHSGMLKNIEFMVGPFTKGIAHREYSEGAYKKFLRRFELEPVDVCYYNFKLFLTPLDKWFPKLTVSVSRRLERLGRSPASRFLATAFIIKARKGTGDGRRAV